MVKIISPTKQILTGNRGAVAIIIGLSIFVLLGFAAFAIDFGYAYVVKNELQNAADAAALAGASVLFHDNELCLAASSPYSCCSGSKTGTCNPAQIDGDNVTMTAQAVAAKNFSGGTQAVPVPTVEVGHFEFNASSSVPGNFTPNPNTPNPTTTFNQMEGWVTQSFSELNTNTNFINAVRVTLSRTDVPRFFSKIWSSNPLAITVQATAYIGFAGTLPPGSLDLPIAICKQSITTPCEDNPNQTCYSCKTGRMINSSTGVTSNTGGWTNFTQPCETATPPSVQAVINKCNVSSPSLAFGTGMGTIGGNDPKNLQEPKGVEPCWMAKCNSAIVPVTSISQCNRSWKVTLPVIDCPGQNVNSCSPLVGTVEIDLLWIWSSSTPDMEQTPTSMTAPNPNSATGDPMTWTSPTACDSKPTCGNNDTSDCRGNCRWNNFVDSFGLKNATGVAPKVGTGTGELKPNDLAFALFFLPDCKVRAPQGGTGGENYGTLARYPVLVNAMIEPVGQ